MAKQKYTSKAPNDKDILVEVEQVKKDTVIKTEFGDALITEGNYIVTHLDDERKGKTFGITKTDLDLFYTPVK